MQIEISHHIYTGKELFLHFGVYIQEKFEKFRDNYGKKYLIYSIGEDYEAGIRVISIVHPFDEFNPKTAKDIIEGRFKREKGELYPRIRYSEMETPPPYVEVSE